MLKSHTLCLPHIQPACQMLTQIKAKVSVVLELGGIKALI